MMTSPSSDEPRRVTLEDLAALNREMGALVASGLPLEAGLQQVASDFGGNMGQLAERLAQETAAGKTLAEAVAAQGDSLPPVYHAVVAAGLRSGHLAAALEGFADTAARIAMLRRIAGQAIVYPLLVVITAWVMLLAVLCLVGPAYDWLELGDRFWSSPLRVSQSTALWLGVGGPLLMLLAAAWWWRSSSVPSGTGRQRDWTRWIPGARRAAMLSGQANFAELLKMLLACRVPLPEALPLAARASGSPALESPAVDIAAQLAAGQSLPSQVTLLRRLPPLVRTALLANPTEAGLLAGLGRAAEVYRERAAAWIVEVAVLLPVSITLVLGIGVVGVYAVLILQPYFATLQDITAVDWH